MAYTIISRNGNNGDSNSFYRKKFQVETRDDILTLPTMNTNGYDKCKVGSQAFCEEDGSVWYLSVDGVTWKEMV